jgi:hypothetical protein
MISSSPLAGWNVANRIGPWVPRDAQTDAVRHLVSFRVVTLRPVEASRRTIVFLAASALFVGGLTLASCGGDGEGSATTDTEVTQTSTTETTTTETTTTETTTTETTTTTEAEADGPTVVRIDVVDGAPKGGIVRETVSKGDRVVLVVTSDVADEVHLHGYDITRDVAAGRTARIAFQATLPGRFEVELEERGVPIADLTVEP